VQGTSPARFTLLAVRRIVLEGLARLGYASKAVVYGIVGALAVLTAMRRGGAVVDTRGALRVVVAQPFGRTLLVVLAVGLCGYAAWRLTDAITDPDGDGTSPRGLLLRVGNAIRGCVYGALGSEAVRLFRGLRRSSGDEAEFWAGRVLDVPFGQLLVGLAGGLIVFHALSEIVQGIRGTHDAKLDWSPIPAPFREPLHRVCRFGVTTRGALIATLGGFLIRAALSHDPNQAAGSRESLIRLGGAIEGRWWLMVIAAGVLAYAVDQAVHARCRRIRAVV
jgi:hypothetical protein